MNHAPAVLAAPALYCIHGRIIHQAKDCQSVQNVNEKYTPSPSAATATRIGRRTAQLPIKAGAWFIHWPVRPVRGLYRPYLTNTKHSIEVTETLVPLNATMAPQRHRISIYHIANILYKYCRCTNFVRVSQMQTTTLTPYAFVSNPVLVLDNP